MKTDSSKMIDVFNIRRAVALDELVLVAEIRDGEGIYTYEGSILPIYLNKKNGIVVNCESPEILEKIVRKREQYLEDKLPTERKKVAITLADGQFAMLVYDLLKNKIHPHDRYNNFMLAYRRCDYNFENASKNMNVSELLRTKRLSPDVFNLLYSESTINSKGDIIVYRGQGSKSCSLEKAISWTLSVDVACRFATSHNVEGDGEIYTAVVNVRDISDFIDCTEKEIIVDYKHLRDVCVYRKGGELIG